ncbi:MAG: FAD:protein FMN transferase [Nocardioidaceae bacterium]
MTALPLRHRVEQVMGLPVTLALRGRHVDDDLAEVAWASAVRLLHEVDRDFSTYRADSWISRLGRGEVGVEDCPPEVSEVLALGEQAKRESDGAFDVRRTDADGAVALDPSGVVKGWAVQRAAQLFSELHETDVCLSAGGDLVCRTAAPGSPGWRIGIEDPADPSRVVAVVPVRDGAVATSGATHRGAHITHGRTGAVPTTVTSVTVVTSDLTWADIDATAAYAQDADALDWLRTRPGRSGLVVCADGHTELFGG